MKTPLSYLTAAVLLLGCSDDKATGQPNTPANASGGAMPDDHGVERSLGNLTVAGHTFEVIVGELKADLPVDLVWPAGKQRAEIARAWVGVESGKGSMKARLNKEGKSVLHNHVDVPKPIPEGSKLWIEIEDGDQKGAGSIAWQ
jgi:hypothetical protein